ncbi:MAG: hypothetical protein ACI8Y4_001711 [Candidatus Poriferisodalaceae bacterium]|jgi:hypothetical protein
MCYLCDEQSNDEWDRSLDLSIRIYGWTAVTMSAGSYDPDGWAYTLGLQENFNHPDLLIFDAAPPAACRILSTLATQVMECGEFTPGFVAAGGQVSPVDFLEYDDEIVHCWEDFYGRAAGPSDFLLVNPAVGHSGHLGV